MALFPSWGDTGGGKEQRTFRFKKDTLRELDRMAKEMDVSASQLADDCLVEGLIHLTLRSSVNAITLGREDIVKILQHIKDDAKLEKIGYEMGESVPRRLYAIYNVEPSWNTLLFSLSTVHSKACGWFEFKHYVRKDTHRLIFTHETGHKWTAFIKGYVTGMIRTLLKVEPKVITATDKLLELIAYGPTQLIPIDNSINYSELGYNHYLRKFKD